MSSLWLGDHKRLALLTNLEHHEARTLRGAHILRSHRLVGDFVKSATGLDTDRLASFDVDFNRALYDVDKHVTGVEMPFGGPAGPDLE